METTGCTLERFTGWLTEIRDEQPTWRAQADREIDYYDGNQLDSETLRDMQDVGMPPIVENVIAPAIDAVLGLEAKTRTDWQVVPDVDQRETPVAEALNYRLNQAEKASRADRACSDAFAAQVKVGLGWVEVSRDLDPFRYPYRVTSVHRNEIFWDMRSREPDGSDMRYLIRRRWTDVDVAMSLFPQHAAIIEHIGNGWSLWDEALTRDGGASTDLAMSYETERGWSIEETEWRDATRKRVCIYEVWYRDWTSGTVLRSPDGRVVEYNPQEAAHLIAVASGRIRPEKRVFAKVRRAYWLGPHQLHDGPSEYKHNRFPYVAFWGKREDRTGVPYGLLRGMLPMQDAVNASESKMQWLLAAKRITQTAGATLDDEEAVRREASRPDAHFILDAQKMREGGIFQVESDFALNEQQYKRLVDKREGIKRVSGVYDAFMGNTGEAKSGVAINSLVEQSTQTLAEVNDNYRFARAEVGELLLSYIIEDIGTQQQTVSIGGTLPGDEPRDIVLNAPITDEQGVRYLDNDVQRTRLKVALSDVPSTPSFRSQQLISLTEVTKSLPPEMQAVITPFVLALTDIPQREAIIKAIKEVSGGQTFTPEMVQAQVQQAVEQALAQSGRDLDEAKLRLEAEKADVEKRRLSLDEFDVKARAHVDKLKAEADWLRAEIEARRQQHDQAIAAAEAIKTVPTEDPNTAPEVLKARIDADAQVEIARIQTAARPEEKDDSEVKRLEAKLDEVVRTITGMEKTLSSESKNDKALESLLKALDKPSEPAAAPVINVTIEKGGAVRKEIEVKSPSGATYKGVVTAEEEE